MLFLLLALLAVMFVGGATFVALLTIGVGIKQRPWKRSLLWCGVSLLPITVLVTILAILFSWYGPLDLNDPKDLAEAYRMEFGVDPPADVREIRCRQVVVGDSGGAWLRFQASRDTINNLLARFVPTDSSTFDKAGAGGNVPTWWRPGMDGVKDYYRTDNWSQSFDYSVAYIGVDHERGIVYFHHMGSD